MLIRTSAAGRPKFPVLLAAALALAASCARTKPDAAGRLREFIDTIPVVDTHEHQRSYPEYDGHDVQFYTLLNHSYLRFDLYSAGAPVIERERVLGGDLDSLWKTYGPYLDFSRNTSYYGHFLEGFRVLYGYGEKEFTDEGVKSLSGEIAANYADRETWYGKAFAKAGFETMLIDQYWAPFDADPDPRYFTLVFNVNRLVSGPTRRSLGYPRDASPKEDVFRLADEEGFSVKILDDYLIFADHLLRKFRDRKAVCLKNSMAYDRDLYYEDVPHAEAEALYARESSSLTPAEKKKLEDFMFHWVCGKSVELGLPIQIHTGYLATNGDLLENGRPLRLNNLLLKYPDARFSLFHGGYPWTGEMAALGKMFPNVYIDLVWLPQISREAAVRSLDEMLDAVPYNKFFWGGDCHFIEESTGSLEFAKGVVAESLARRVDRGLLTEKAARDVALKIFRDNAVRFFGLQEKPENK
ncbi:MAG: amidohydrolase family protein [Candidatus Aminicenantales bacterium]